MTRDAEGDFVAMVGGRDLRLRDWACTEIAARGTCSAPLARAMLDAFITDDTVNEVVLRAAWECRKDFDSLLEGLLAELKDGDAETREKAARLLDRRAILIKDKGVRGSSVRAAVARAAGDSGEGVRIWACSLLSRYPDAVAECVPVLVRSLSDPSPNVRKKAAYSLGELGAAARNSLGSLGGLLRDADSNVRRHAARSISAICESMPDALSTRLETPEPRRDGEGGAERNRGAMSGTIRGELLLMLEDEATECVVAAIESLRLVPGLTDEERDRISLLRDHADPGVRVAARMLVLP